MHEEREPHTAKELGIPMPSPTVKPLVTAFGILVMFCGPIFLHLGRDTIADILMFGGAGLMVAGLYAWLLTPLEEAHR